MLKRAVEGFADSRPGLCVPVHAFRSRDMYRFPLVLVSSMLPSAFLNPRMLSKD